MTADPCRAVRQFDRMVLNSPQPAAEDTEGELVCTVVYNHETNTLTYVRAEDCAQGGRGAA